MRAFSFEAALPGHGQEESRLGKSWAGQKEMALKFTPQGHTALSGKSERVYQLIYKLDIL